jgi:hypothetical protein
MTDTMANPKNDSKNDLDWEVCPAENKPKDKRFDKMEAQFLPKLPATFYILGSCGSGKSSILWTLLTKGYVYGSKNKSVFDEALIYLGTQDAKASFEKLPIKNKLILEEYDPVSFETYQNDLKAHQMQRLEKNKSALNSLIIFDDFVGAGLMKKPRPNAPPPVEKLALTSRHECNATIMFCSQIYKNSGFSAPSVRNNITTFIVSRMSHQELVKIAEELSENYEVDEWLEYYDQAMKTPYNFVVLDRRRPITEDRWTIKFSTPFPPSKKTLRLKGLLDNKVLPNKSDSEE